MKSLLMLCLLLTGVSNVWAAIGGGVDYDPGPGPALAGFPTGSVHLVAAGDVDGNGFDDIVVVDSGSPPMMWLWRQTSLGVFATPTTFAVGTGDVYSPCIDMADADGDGQDEILVEYSAPAAAPTLHVLNWNGTTIVREIVEHSIPLSGLKNPFGMPVTTGATGGVTSCRFIDLDPDGVANTLDIAVTKSGIGDGGAILFYNGIDWQQEPFMIGTGSSAVTGPISIVAGDYDNDGSRDELVIMGACPIGGMQFYNVDWTFQMLHDVARGTGTAYCGDAREFEDGVNGSDIVVFNDDGMEPTYFVHAGGGAFNTTTSQWPMAKTGWVGAMDSEGDTKIVTTAGCCDTGAAVYRWNGTESLAVPNTVGLDSFDAQQIVVLDYNGDGRNDIAVNRGDGDIGWYTLGACMADVECPNAKVCNAGVCEAVPPIPPLPAAPLSAVPNETPQEIRLADFNNDGRLDYVMVSSVGSALVYRGGATPGSFTFSASPTSSTGMGKDVEVGDCDNDGDLDFIDLGYYFGGNNYLRIFKNNGAGIFTDNRGNDVINLGIGVSTSLALADLDGDGFLDVAAVGENGGVSLFKNQGNCNFGNPASPNWVSSTSYADADLTFIPSPTGIQLVVSHDGGLEVLSRFDPSTFGFTATLPGKSTDTDRTVAGQWANSAFMLLATQTIGDDANLMTRDPMAYLTSNSFGQATDIEFCDVTNDEVVDLVVINGDGSRLQIFEAADLTNPAMEFVPPTAYPGSKFLRARCGGVGTSGASELVILMKDATTHKITHLAPNPGVISNRTTTLDLGGGLLPDVLDIRVADMDNDQDLDVIAAGWTSALGGRVSVFKNTSGYSKVTTPRAGANAVPIADFDGDGDIDIAMIPYSLTSLPEIMANNGTGAFATDSYASALILANRSDGVWADVDNDFVVDLATCGSDGVRIIKGTPGGVLDNIIFNSVSVACTDLLAADFDADGDLDLLAMASYSPQVRFLVNDGAGTFTTPYPAFDVDIAVNEDIADAAVADIDNDGLPDIVFASSGSVIVKHNEGGFVLDEWWRGDAGSNNWRDVAVADFNLDGKPDFVAVGIGAVPFAVWVDDSATGGLSYALASEIANPALDFSSVAVGDVDSDGDPDILAGGQPGSIRLTAWYNPTNPLMTPFGGVFPSTLPNNPSAVVVHRSNSPDAVGEFGAGRPIVPDSNGFIKIPFTAYDRDADPVWVEVQWHKPNFGWTNATLAGAPAPFSSSPTGVDHAVTWNVNADNAFGQGIQVRFRVRQTPGRIAFPIQGGPKYSYGPHMTIMAPCGGACPGECVAGQCLSVACTNDGECTPDLCLSGWCAPADLCASAVCPSGTECYEGTCFPTCVDDGDCTPPYACIEDIGRCAVDSCDGVICFPGDSCFGGECRDACPCGPGFECYTVESGNVCLPTGNACDTVDCPVAFSCYEGACFADPACVTTADCSMYGPDSACWDFGCATVADVCADIACPEGSSCWMGACFTGCAADVDCSAEAINTECYDAGICGPPTGLCGDVVCPEGHACWEGACFPTCVDDSDCTPPNVCADAGVCLDGGNPCGDLTCPVGDVCYQGACYDACADNSDCSPPFSLCWESLFCISTSDPCSNVTCPLGFTCHEGSCFESCGGSDPCAPPLECFQDYCTTQDDACDGVRCPEGHTCYQGGCFAECVDSTDCGTPEICFGEPIASPMSAPPDPATTATTERCAVDACQDVFCGEGDICYMGACFPACGDDADCTLPNYCYVDHCTDDPCANVDCEIGSMCVGGSCFLACGANNDCPGFVAGPQNFTNVAPTLSAKVTGNKEAGAIWFDYNGDGCLDFIVNTSDGTVKTRIFRNNCMLPDPGFTDVTNTAAPWLLSSSAKERSVIAGDIDNDGDLDFARNTGWRIEIFKNDGAGGFGASPVSTIDTSDSFEGMAFLDYDADGDLDLVAEESTEDGVVRLLRNDGSGSFSTITGVGLPSSASDNGDYLAAGDIDQDGDVDFIVRKNGSIRDLYLNDGDGTWTSSGAFQEDTDDSNKGGVVMCDFDNDGDFDIFWSDRSTNQIWKQTSPLTFVATNEPATSAGVTPSNIDGIACGDVNNDGWLDLVLSASGTDYLYINTSTSSSLSFERDNRGITGAEDGESVVLGDYDQSGSLDVLINQDVETEIWRNPLRDDRYLIIAPQIDLGAGKTRAAIGATIKIRDPDNNILGTREVNGGKGHGAQDPADVHYGLIYGARVPYKLVVTFPGGGRVTKCITPNTIAGYQRIVIKDTDSNDTSACTAAGPSWTGLI